MIPVFADTSYYLALLNPADAYHDAAVRCSQTVRSPILLTEFIIVELGNSLSRVQNRELFLKLVASLRDDPNTTIVPASSDLIESGLRLFSARNDKDWSLTDCVSFVVMEQYSVTEALTSDRHFEQAGFRTLLR
jgi:uncharacterized protein